MMIKSQNRKYKTMVWLMLFLLITTFVASIFIGKYKLDVFKTIPLIFSGESLESSEKIAVSVLLDIRLPRIIMSLLVGIGLSISGTTYQAILRNPLASPDILGTSSAAAFGAAMGILLFSDSAFAISICAFGFGVLSMLIVFFMTNGKKHMDILSLILAGMITRSIFMSLIALVKFVADTEETLPAITFWLMGSFSSICKYDVVYFATVLLLCFLVLYLLRWKLNIISLGDDEAIIQNINPIILKTILLMTVSVIISVSVTVSGMIGWVGLVIPHITRGIVGSNHGKLLPLSGMIGGVFLMVVDDIARTITYAETPIGILTAVIGAPIFAVLFMYGGKKHAS